jgi:small GTP-binding protein
MLSSCVAEGRVIQKKICMVGVFGTGKTSLVQQFIYSKFSEKYHSTVGVKIDRKQVTVAGTEVNLLLWDLAGQDKFQGVQGSYLRGSAGIFFVVDGTRRETLTDLAGLQALVKETVGEVPAVIAINKADLEDQWQLGQGDFDGLFGSGRHVLKTSAKTGVGVDDAFLWLAGQMLKG